MRTEKWLMRLVNLLLAVSFAFGVLVFLEQFSQKDWPWYSRCLRCWPLLLCFPAGFTGRALPRLKLPALAASLLLAEGVMLLIWPSFRPLDIVYLVLAAAVGAVLYLLGLRGEEPFPPRLAVATLILYLGSSVYFLLGDAAIRDFQPVCWCGLASFCLALYSFNAASLHTGVHNVKGGESMTIPSGIRGKNLRLLTAFLVVALLIGSLGILHQALAATGRFALYGVKTVIDFMAGLSEGGGPTVSTAATPAPEEQTVGSIADIAEDGDPTFAIVYGILLALFALVFFLLAYGFIREGRKGGFGRRLARWAKDLLRTREVLEYEDDVERTGDLREALKERAEKARKWVKRLRERPERYEDMPDERMRLRFVYRALLRSGRVEGWRSSSTPREVGEALETPALKRMPAAYAAARYDLVSEPTAEDAAAGLAALEVLQRRGR